MASNSGTNALPAPPLLLSPQSKASACSPPDRLSLTSHHSVKRPQASKGGAWRARLSQQ